jgi:putative polymerase
MPQLLNLLPSILVVWATIFNGVLAIVNAHVTTLSPVSVMGAEGLTVGLAHFWAFKHFREEMKVWYVLLSIMFALFLVRSLLTGVPEIRYVRDVLIVPTFIVLGMTSQRENMTKTVCIIHLIVLVVMFYEAINTDGFARLFEIQDYYIHTRGYQEDNFWNKESELFVNAVRPQDRIFLPFLDLHRLSSIFLEPVSLGNYCVLITAYMCATFPSLSRMERWFLGLGNVSILIGSDGRLAAVSSAVIILASLAAARLPRGSALFYLPGAVLIATLATYFGGFHDGPDDFAGRTAHTVTLLSQCDMPELIGISERLLGLASDSGVVYMILTQSLIGMSLIWILIVAGAREDRLEQIRYTHAIGIYLSLAMIVSNAVFTIKTAGLLWFVQGVLQKREGAGSATPWLAGMIERHKQPLAESRAPAGATLLRLREDRTGSTD